MPSVFCVISHGFCVNPDDVCFEKKNDSNRVVLVALSRQHYLFGTLIFLGTIGSVLEY
jgi:hypothetical protein